MGLKFEKPEAVQFGEIIATPKLTTELKLRLQTGLAKNQASTAEGLAELTKLLASCFPSDKDDVAAYIDSYMGLNDIAKLATYLLAGQEGLANLEKTIGGEE